MSMYLFVVSIQRIEHVSLSSVSRFFSSFRQQTLRSTRRHALVVPGCHSSCPVTRPLVRSLCHSPVFHLGLFSSSVSIIPLSHRLPESAGWYRGDVLTSMIALDRDEGATHGSFKVEPSSYSPREMFCVPVLFRCLKVTPTVAGRARTLACSSLSRTRTPGRGARSRGLQHPPFPKAASARYRSLLP